jgi:hypothetical protein
MSNSYYEKGAIHHDHHKELHIDTLNGGDIGKLLSAFFKDDAEEAEVVEEVKEVANECDELLVNDVFSDELFTTNQQLLQLRTIINESVGMGDQNKIDLSKGLEWYWLYQAIFDAGLFETRSNRENVVTMVGFVRQMAKWLPDIIDIDDEERIRNICKSMSAEQAKWMMNGKPVNLVDIEANKRRMTAMKTTKKERIVSVAYNGLYTKLVALKQEIAKEKATR